MKVATRVWPLFLMIGTGMTSPVSGQAVLQFTTDGEELVRISPPGSEEGWSCANYQVKDTWRVGYDSVSSIRVWRSGPADSADSRPVQLPVSRGWLIGYNSGEFGGQLVFRDSANQEEKSILASHPVALFRVPGRVILVEGIGHMGLREGHVISLTEASPGRWSVEDSIDVQAAPAAATLLGDTVVIATGEGVVKVSVSGKTVTPVYRNDNWYQVYATTILRLQDETIVIGMRRAIAVLTPSTDGYREQWLVPASCRVLDGPRNGPCVCTS
jgi:hypothetical protein